MRYIVLGTSTSAMRGTKGIALESSHRTKTLTPRLRRFDVSVDLDTDCDRFARAHTYDS